VTEMQAWNWITSRWCTDTWTPIDPLVRTTLRLPILLGIAHGQLVTRKGACGGQEFIKRINSRSYK